MVHTVRYAVQFYYSFYQTHSENNNIRLRIIEIHLEAKLSEGLSLNAAIFFFSLWNIRAFIFFLSVSFLPLSLFYSTVSEGVLKLSVTGESPTVSSRCRNTDSRPTPRLLTETVKDAPSKYQETKSH